MALQPSAASSELGVPGAAASLTWAVVSFLLEDAVWCDWLYREFDGERIPRQLINRPSRFGTPYPDRISVSPDPADPSQLESYTDTLQAAQHLILVVSPTSGKSPVLQEHLRLFKAGGGEERVIALVVKGEPASPAAEPGAMSDREWLPTWLQWRFEGNQFRSAGPTEPLVVDARMGVASLAEARARLMAALLEVDREALNELGIITRPTTSLVTLPVTAKHASAPEPTPSTATFVEIAAEAPTVRRQSSLALWLCALAAIAALGFLAWWPEPAIQAGSSTNLPRLAKRAGSVIDPDTPLVEAKPIYDAPLPISATAAAPNASASAPSDVNQPSPETGAEMSERLAAIARRDRLTRTAESRMAEGLAHEAHTFLAQALAAGREALAFSDSTQADAIDLALLYRRAGTLAEGLAMPAAAKQHYENGRQTLLGLRSNAPLSRETLKLLADLEDGLRKARP